jgi:hypothetical protein
MTHCAETISSKNEFVAWYCATVAPQTSNMIVGTSLKQLTLCFNVFEKYKTKNEIKFKKPSINNSFAYLISYKFVIDINV